MTSTVRFAPRAEPTSSTWRKLPKIGGSRWGFIGLIAGIALVVLLGIIIGICCCVRKRRSRRRLGRAAQGSDLSALHPTPSFGRPPNAAQRGPKFMPIHDEEEDAFVAHSPRNSLSYAGAYATPHNGGYQHKHSGSAATEDMNMDGYNHRQQYYRGSEGFRNNYAYGHDATGGGYAAGHASNEPSYDYGYPTTQHGQFAEPEYGHAYETGGVAAGYPPPQQSQQYPHATPYGATAGVPQSPSVLHGPRMPVSAAPSAASPYHEHRGAERPEEYYGAHNDHNNNYASHDSYAPQPSNMSVAPTESVPPPYITYDHGSGGSASQQQQQQSYDAQPMSPHRKPRIPGGASV